MSVIYSDKTLYHNISWSKYIIVCVLLIYFVLLGFTHLLHTHDDGHEDHTESFHILKHCSACVFTQINNTIEIQPISIVSPTFCYATLSQHKVDILPILLQSNIRCRAPPIFSI